MHMCLSMHAYIHYDIACIEQLIQYEENAEHHVSLRHEDIISIFFLLESNYDIIANAFICLTFEYSERYG